MKLPYLLAYVHLLAFTAGLSRLIALRRVYLSLRRGPTVHLINVSSIQSISRIDPPNRSTTGVGEFHDTVDEPVLLLQVETAALNK